MAFPKGETEVVISEMTRARRRNLTAVWVMMAFAGGLATWWAATTLSHCSDAYERAHEQPAAPDAPKRRQAAAAPIRDDARVYLHLSRAGRISVDGRPVGRGVRERVDLAPGGHILTAEIGPAKMSQQVQVEAGDELLIEFDDGAAEGPIVQVRRLVPFEP